MKELRTGEVNGLRWTLVDLAKPCLERKTAGTRDRSGPCVVLTPKAIAVPPSVITALGVDRKGVYYPDFQLHEDPGFRPIDETALFPDNPVAYYRQGFSHFDADAWARTQIDIPDNVDVSFEYDGYRHKLHVIATTIRKGALTKVRKRISKDVPFVDAVTPILAYFSRNCPRVEAGTEAQYICGGHVNEILEGLTGFGHRNVSEAITPVKEERLRWRTVQIAGEMLMHPGPIREITLRRQEEGTSVHAQIKLEGGHEIAEDAQGITVTLEAELCETLLAALKGRSLGDLVDAPWTRAMTIRTARQQTTKAPNGKDRSVVILRVQTQREPLRLPNEREDTREQISTALRSLAHRFNNVDEPAAGILGKLPPADMARVLSRLAMQEYADLTSFGLKDWTLKRQYGRVTVERSPMTTISSMLDAAGIAA